MPATACRRKFRHIGRALLFVCASTGFSQSLQASDSGSQPRWKVGHDLTFNRTRTKELQGFAPSTSRSNVHSLTVRRQLTPELAGKLAVVGLNHRTTDDRIEPGFSKASFLNWKSVGVKAGLEAEFFGFGFSTSILAGHDKYRLVRADQFSGALAESRSKGWHIYTDASVHKDIWLTEWLFLQPAATLRHAVAHADAFNETGAGPANLSVAAIDDERLSSELGLTVSVILPLETNGLLSPFASARWAHNFQTGPYSAQTSSTVLGDLGDVAIARGPEADGLRLTGGVLWRLPFGPEATVAYTGEFFKSSRSHAVTAVLGFPF